MSERLALSVAIDPALHAELVDEAADALRRFIQVGIDSLRNEATIDHDELMAELSRREKVALERKNKSAA